MSSASTKRTVALCYIRLSVTKNASDLTSPERQRANIQAACDRNGWIPEWYEDAKGHKSATKEENRPEWTALKTRLNDPDVAALVVNDQSRAMRNAWRAIKLFEELPSYGVKLHLAAVDRTIDISTPDGRMNAYFQAFLDDLYALDASRRAKDSVRYRKAKGVSIGIPPFGTVRDQKGFLVASPYGTWFMPDGTFQPGEQGEERPHPDAVWRGYYECAEQILRLYKDNLHGYDYIAKHLNRDKWAFRDRWGQPRALKLDDVRRVASAWREYAGIVQQGKASQRAAYKIKDPTSDLQDTGRAVFDLDLLRAVAETQEKRSATTKAVGVSQAAHIFALSSLLYCAHCDRLADENQDFSLRSRLTGWNQQGKLRYRHSESNRCDCKTRTVFADEVEQDFARLIQVLEVRPEAIDLMAELAMDSHFGVMKADDEQAFEDEKKIALATHRRGIKNNLLLFQAGEIDIEEYQRQKDHHERQIAIWEARTSDRQKLKLELTTCMEFVKRLKLYWDITDGEDRKLLAHSLFDEIVYDLDRRQMVDFKVKAWAEPFLMLRAGVYQDEMSEEMKNRFNSGFSRDIPFHDPNGTRTRVFTLKG